MAGCFGNSPVDRWMEQQLNEYLNSDTGEFLCDCCQYQAVADDLDYDDETNELICPNCKTRIKL